MYVTNIKHYYHSVTKRLSQSGKFAHESDGTLFGNFMFFWKSVLRAEAPAQVMISNKSSLIPTIIPHFCLNDILDYRNGGRLFILCGRRSWTTCSLSIGELQFLCALSSLYR